jgi:hypothetical protein
VLSETGVRQEATRDFQEDGGLLLPAITKSADGSAASKPVETEPCRKAGPLGNVPGGRVTRTLMSGHVQLVHTNFHQKTGIRLGSPW